MKRNKVYLAGAGPGDPGLITLRALNLIKTCDVIIYDPLVNPLLLNYKKNGAVTRNIGDIGKGGGSHGPSVEEVNKLTLKYFKEGKSVLRLKGGDPWLFSRGGEETEFFVDHGIPFEIIPGVSSPIAVSAYAGIPISHHKYASSVAIAIGHPAHGKSLDELEFPTADTVVVLMVTENLSHIIEKLIGSGKAPDLPTALIQNGTWGRQKTAVGTLKTIVEIADRENIGSPAILVAGDVVRLRDYLHWFERLPLFGKRLVVAGPWEEAEEIVLRLAELGADVVHSPTVPIKEKNVDGVISTGMVREKPIDEIIEPLLP